MLFEFSVLLRCPSPLKCTKRHSKLRRSTATTSMTRWSFPLHWKLDARLSIPKIFTMARQLMDNSPFEIPSLDHPANNLYNVKSRSGPARFHHWAGIYQTESGRKTLEAVFKSMPVVRQNFSRDPRRGGSW